MLKNYVHETTTGTTWPLALQGALATGYRTVLGAFGSGKKALLTVRNRSTPSEWETALYTVNADGSINRVAGDVRDGTNGVGALTVFTAGVKDVICDADAALLLALAAKSYWGGTTTNGGNAYAVTVSEPVPTAYSAGMVVLAVINAANTGAATINVNGLGAKAITKSGTTALAAGDLPANAMVALTYDGTQFQLSTGAGAGTSGGGWTVVSKAVAYTVLAADKNTYFLCSGSFTLSLTAAATMGAGMVIGVKNNGTGSITIDPNGAETINGVSTLALFQGDTVVLICDGANWHVFDSYTSQGSPTFSNVVAYATPGSTTFTVPAGVTRIRVRVFGAGGGGGTGYYSGGGTGGHGGGGGGFAEKTIAVTPGAAYTATVGAGGVGSIETWSRGATGGTSSFGSVCSATGGLGGGNSSYLGDLVGGAGGAGIGGDVNRTGGVGSVGGDGGGESLGGGGGGGAGVTANGGAAVPSVDSSWIAGLGGTGSGGAAGGGNSGSGGGAPGANGSTFEGGGGGSGANQHTATSLGIGGVSGGGGGGGCHYNGGYGRGSAGGAGKVTVEY